MMVFPDAEGPNSFDRSTLIVRIVPSTLMSTFFTQPSSASIARRKVVDLPEHADQEGLRLPAGALGGSSIDSSLSRRVSKQLRSLDLAMANGEAGEDGRPVPI